MENKPESKKMGGWAFLPFLILVGLVIARILYNIFTGTPQTGNSFSILSVTIVATVASFFIGRGKVGDRFDAFSKGAADPTTLMMFVILLLAGIFTAVSKEMGGIDSMVNLCLHFVPQNMIYAGILLVTSIISLSIGTSVGTVAAMAPIAAGLALQAGLNLPLAISAVVGGSILGDNLSFVSDTTIAATRGIGCEMSDKFNVLIVIPAFLAALVIYALLGINSASATVEIGDFNIIKIIPYLYIIVAAVCGMNIATVLVSGICLAAVVGFCFGNFTIATFMDTVATGMKNMTNTIFTALLVKGIMGVVDYNGGTDWLIGRLTKNIKGAKGAQYSVAALAFCLGALIRSTSAIIVAAPLAKDITKPYDIDPRRTASLLDIFATAQNGFIFWAGLTMDASSLVEGITSLDLVRLAIYPALVIIMAIISVQFNLFRKDKTKAAN